MAGRLMTKRDMGKAAFYFNFQDATGALQAYVRLEELSERDPATFLITSIWATGWASPVLFFKNQEG